MTHMEIAERSAHEFIIQVNKPAGRLVKFRADRIARAEGRAVTRTARLKLLDRNAIIRLVSDFCEKKEDGDRFADRVRKCSSN